jgi:diguanylate cyclase (GGDEF)-like protein
MTHTPLNTSAHVQPTLLYITHKLDKALEVKLQTFVQVIVITNCQHALKTARIQPVDAILLNYDDMGLAGLKFMEDRHQYPELFEVPCMLMSASSPFDILDDSLFEEFYIGDVNSPLFIKRIQNFIRSNSRLHMWGSRLENSSASLTLMAYYDTLTALPNRQLFEMHAAKAIDTATCHNQSTGLFFIDLDNFKEINDTFGHPSGDALLKVVAQRIKSVVRRQDFVARLGGDEFVVVLGGIPERTIVHAIAERILQSINQPIILESGLHTVTASMGAALSQPHSKKALEALKTTADKAMYQAKKNGGNQFILAEDKPI